jgi:hypothetical protein
MKGVTMKIIVFIIMLSTVCWMSGSVGLAAEPGNQKEQVVAGPYNPAIKYSGDYSSDVILFKNLKSTVWERLPRLGRLLQVTCQDASNALNREGKWQGRLKQDGSCGSDAEPLDWITGNRLNYENALEDQQGK